MPRRAPRPCRVCGAASTGGYCARHADRPRQEDRARGSAAARGYDARWRQYRARFLARHPLCQLDCQRAGRTTPATVVDHITPHRGDRRLFWDPANHQASCARCHSRKTAREDGGFGNRRRDAARSQR